MTRKSYYFSAHNLNNFKREHKPRHTRFLAISYSLGIHIHFFCYLESIFITYIYIQIQSKRINILYFLFKKSMYLLERATKRKTQRSSICSVTPHMTIIARARPAEPHLGFPYGCRGPNAWAVIHCLPRHIRKSSWDLNSTPVQDAATVITAYHAAPQCWALPSLLNWPFLS